MYTILLILSKLVLHTLTFGVVKLKSNHALAGVVKLAVHAIPPFAVLDQDVDSIGNITRFNLACAFSIL